MGKTHACGRRGLYFGFVAPLNEPYDTISSRCPPAACRGVLTSHLYAQDYQGSALRAIAALLQAKYSPLLKIPTATEPSPRYDMQKEPRPFIDDTTNGRGFLQPHLGPRGWMSISGALVRLRQGMVGQKRSLRHIASRTYFLSTRILSKERRPSAARLALC